MATANSTRTSRPNKPHPDFPLFPHARGYWSKKVRGKLHYFGRWENPDAALAEWNRVKDDLLAGRKPRPTTADGLTIAVACNQLLESKSRLVESGELSQRQFDDLLRAAKTVTSKFGRGRMVEDLRPDDFRELRASLAKRYKSPASMKREIANIKQIFNYAYKNDLIDKPVKFGEEFSPPAKKVFRKHRDKVGPRMFEPGQIRELLDDASPQLKAMVLLAVNCGLGNSDVWQLEKSHIDLDKGWLDYSRRKTGVKRRAKLWAITVVSLRECIDKRTRPKQPKDEPLVFITKYGKPWGQHDKSHSPISAEFRKLLDANQFYRRGLSFYTLRHVFETVGGASRDQAAVDHAMGHERDDMASQYREGISDDRLEAVATHVHAWLYGGA